MNSVKCVCGFLAVFFIGGSAFGQSYKWNLQAGGGVNYNTGSQNIDNFGLVQNVYGGYGLGYAAHLACYYSVSKSVSIGLVVPVSTNNVDAKRVNLAHGIFEGRYTFFSNKTFIGKPYIGMGVGAGMTNLVNTAERSTFSPSQIVDSALIVPQNLIYNDERYSLNYLSLTGKLTAGARVQLSKRSYLFLQGSVQTGFIPNSGNLKSYVPENKTNNWLNLQLELGYGIALAKTKPKVYPATFEYYVVTRDSAKPISGVTIEVKTDSTEQIIKNISGKTNALKIDLKSGKNYKVKVRAPFHTIHEETLKLDTLTKKISVTKNVSLVNKVFTQLYFKDAQLFFTIKPDLRVQDSISKMPLPVRALADSGFFFPIGIGRKTDITVKTPKYTDTTVSVLFPETTIITNDSKQVMVLPRRIKVSVNPFDNETKNPLDIDVIALNLELNEPPVKGALDLDGAYALSLREGHNYKIMISTKKDYFFADTVIATPLTATNDTVSGANIVIDFPMQKLFVGQKLLLRDIYFKYKSNELFEDSYEEINRIIGLMNDNPLLVIEIAAHTDNVGKATDNLALSQKRAQFVADYLSNRSIDPSRLKPIGYGESKPLVPNDTDENKAKNRRLELIVVSF